MWPMPPACSASGARARVRPCCCRRGSRRAHAPHSCLLPPTPLQPGMKTTQTQLPLGDSDTERPNRPAEQLRGVASARSGPTLRRWVRGKARPRGHPPRAAPAGCAPPSPAPGRAGTGRLCATGPSAPAAAAARPAPRAPPPPSPYSFKSLPSTSPIGSDLLPGHGAPLLLQ